jgi:hypothetical protein
MAVAAGREHREQNIGERKPCYSFITLDSVCYEDDAEEDTTGVRTLQNLRGYSIKSAIFNFAAAWKEMKTTTLANGWTKLLQDMEPENHFKGFETSDFQAIMKRSGGDVSESSVEQWLVNDDSDPGYQILSQEEIADSVLQGSEEDDDVIEEESASSCPKLSIIRNHMDDMILYTRASSDLEVLAYYGHFSQFHSIIIKKQHASGKQLKIDSFFQPTCSQ